ncbi:MAG: hypothetical protein ACREUU_13730 [Gammaproteobacteria bacterium]
MGRQIQLYITPEGIQRLEPALREKLGAIFFADNSHEPRIQITDTVKPAKRLFKRDKTLDAYVRPARARDTRWRAGTLI